MTNQDAIRPFRIEIRRAGLEDLRSWLVRTRWPDRPRVDDWSRGVPATYLRQLATAINLTYGSSHQLALVSMG